MQATPYLSIGLGGTFDHFHLGHQYFLHFAAAMGQRILVGVTTPELVRHKEEGQSIEAFSVRIAAVKKFLVDEHISGEAFPLDNPYGPTLAESLVTALAVTEQTVTGAALINQRRQELDLNPLPFQVCTLLRDSTGERISSTRIRLGQINRNGEVYREIFGTTKKLHLKQLSFFAAPQGKVLSENELAPDPHAYIVGDIVTDTFLRKQLPFQLAIFDRRSLRSPYSSHFIEAAVSANNLPKLKNKAGEISFELGQWLEKYLNKEKKTGFQSAPKFLEIEGEEDLATVALATLAPPSTHIYYGQPNQGIVKLIVTEQLKERFASLLKQPF